MFSSTSCSPIARHRLHAFFLLLLPPILAGCGKRPPAQKELPLRLRVTGVREVRVLLDGEELRDKVKGDPDNYLSFEVKELPDNPKITVQKLTPDGWVNLEWKRHEEYAPYPGWKPPRNDNNSHRNYTIVCENIIPYFTMLIDNRDLLEGTLSIGQLSIPLEKRATREEQSGKPDPYYKPGTYSVGLPAPKFSCRVKIDGREVGNLLAEPNPKWGGAYYLLDVSGKREYRWQRIVYVEEGVDLLSNDPFKNPGGRPSFGVPEFFLAKHLHHLPGHPDHFLSEAKRSVTVERRPGEIGSRPQSFSTTELLDVTDSPPKGQEKSGQR